MNKKQNRNAVLKSKQSGLSLIELMISMVVGLFLLVGVVSNFISNTNSDIKRDAVSEMDANAAEAFRMLRSSITHAGYKSIENTRLEDDMAFFVGDSAVSNVSCRNGTNRDKWTVPTTSKTRDNDSMDVLTVISLADNPCVTGSSACLAGSDNENQRALVYTDCIGGGALRDAYTVSCSTDPLVGMLDPTDAKIYNSFWLEKDTTSDNDRTLFCGGSRSVNGPQAIVNDVETIQYLYGVKNDAGSITYRSANDITTDDQWRMVVSVQVGLLMRSSNQYVLDAPSTKLTYNILNYDANIDASDSRRLFRVYTTTINIENQNTGALL